MAQETSKSKQKQVPIDKIVKTSFLMDVVDLLANGLVAILTGSIVLFAIFLQNIANVVASGFVYIGVLRSKRPPSKIHPFGYGRELYLWTLFSSIIMLTILSGLSIYFGYERIINPSPVEHIIFAFGVFLFSLGTNVYSFSLSAKRLFGENYAGVSIGHNFLNSPLLETRAIFTIDFIGALAAFFGIFSLGLYTLTGDIRFDGVGAIIIGCTMIAFAFLLFLATKDFLIGRSAPKEMIKQIKEITKGSPGVKEIVDVKTTMIGSETALVYIEIHAQKDLVTDQLESVIDVLEKRIRTEFPIAKYIYVELEKSK